MTIFEHVHKVVAQIPKGKVMTYGQIAQMIGTTPRVVGFALHANKTPDTVPCHRVVNREGRVAPGYAFGGHEIQKKLLTAEGVHFIDDLHADLRTFLWAPTSR